MSFRNIFERKIDKNTAKKELEKWYKKVQDEWIIQLTSAANSIENHQGKILGYFKNRETNASAESFNAKIKGFRSLVREVRDIKFFLYRVEKLYA